MSTLEAPADTSPMRGIQPRSEQFCTFKLGPMLFGVEVMSVQEVLLQQQMTRMPLASPVVLGLLNLRGQIVTAIDLRRRFGLPPLAPELEPMNVVVRTGDTAFSLIVDEIGDVVDVDPDAFEAPPDTLTGMARGLILGAYKLERKLLLVLDTDRAVSIDDTP